MNDLSIDAFDFNLDLDLSGANPLSYDNNNNIIDNHNDNNHNNHSLSPPRHSHNSHLWADPDDDNGQLHHHQQDALADTSMSGAGAGPLPTGYGMQLPPSTGSTLTEFTKRRNWSQRVVEEIRDFLHILSPDGRILYVSPSTLGLTGYEPTDLVGKFIISFVHPDDTGLFVKEFNESIASGNPLRFYYRFRKPDDSYIIFESHGHAHLATEAATYGPENGASYCRGFFMMARLYPTKNAALLDSFLEHKMENERLKKRIAELKKEERDDLGATTAQGKSAAIISPTSATWTATQRDEAPDASAFPPINNAYGGMPPPAKPGTANAALTQRNLSEALASAGPDTINDKMARYEGASHLETIEMITGLRYRDGERSKGISTGATSPTLIRGDGPAFDHDDRGANKGYPGIGIGMGMGMGIGIGMGMGIGVGINDGTDGFLDSRKKRLKLDDEFVCTDCGTLDSPEWRKGPNGPKTLCNACGLRWAKKEKRKSVSVSRNAGDGTPGAASAFGGGGGGSGGMNGSGSGSGSLSAGVVATATAMEQGPAVVGMGAQQQQQQPEQTRLLPESAGGM